MRTSSSRHRTRLWLSAGLLTSSLCLVWHSDLAHALRYLRVSHAANNKTQSSNSERTPLIGSTSRQNGAETGRSSPDEHQHTYHVSPSDLRSECVLAETESAADRAD